VYFVCFVLNADSATPILKTTRRRVDAFKEFFVVPAEPPATWLEGMTKIAACIMPVTI
jgi:hypothetical protein